MKIITAEQLDQIRAIDEKYHYSNAQMKEIFGIQAFYKLLGTEGDIRVKEKKYNRILAFIKNPQRKDIVGGGMANTTDELFEKIEYLINIFMIKKELCKAIGCKPETLSLLLGGKTKKIKHKYALKIDELYQEYQDTNNIKNLIDSMEQLRDISLKEIFKKDELELIEFKQKRHEEYSTLLTIGKKYCISPKSEKTKGEPETGTVIKEYKHHYLLQNDHYRFSITKNALYSDDFEVKECK